VTSNSNLKQQMGIILQNINELAETLASWTYETIRSSVRSSRGKPMMMLSTCVMPTPYSYLSSAWNRLEVGNTACWANFDKLAFLILLLCKVDTSWFVKSRISGKNESAPTSVPPRMNGKWSGNKTIFCWVPVP
jgi:hypothetical protein